MTEQEPIAKGFVAQMKAYFGRKPDQSLREFADELKTLSPEDRAEFTQMLNDAGYPVQA